MPLKLSIVTAENSVLERDDVTKIVVPTTEGQITVLPSHAALMTSLDIGEMVVHVPDGVVAVVIHGGFFQVSNDEVTVLADAAEHAEAIDEERAQAAVERAQARLEGRDTEIAEGALDILRAQLALRRALMRLNVKRRRSGTGVPSRTA
jgi:F-type H+-transporting ATPase subunit epsilon